MIVEKDLAETLADLARERDWPALVRWLRADAGMTVAEIAVAVGSVSRRGVAGRTTVRRWETGESRPTGGYRLALVRLVRRVEIERGIPIPPA